MSSGPALWPPRYFGGEGITFSSQRSVHQETRKFNNDYSDLDQDLSPTLLSTSDELQFQSESGEHLHRHRTCGKNGDVLPKSFASSEYEYASLSEIDNYVASNGPQTPQYARNMTRMKGAIDEGSDERYYSSEVSGIEMTNDQTLRN